MELLSGRVCRGFGGVIGAVDLNPELGNPIRGAAEVTPCDRFGGNDARPPGNDRRSKFSMAAMSGCG